MAAFPLWVRGLFRRLFSFSEPDLAAGSLFRFPIGFANRLRRRAPDLRHRPVPRLFCRSGALPSPALLAVDRSQPLVRPEMASRTVHLRLFSFLDDSDFYFHGGILLFRRV